ncbi:MAG: response regulator [Bacteroidota bacterium]
MILPDLVLEKFKSVLLIDDDDLVNSMNMVMINRARFAEKVIAKNSVTEALSFLQKSSERENLPEMIFLDLNMPYKDGWDFMDEFKKIDHKSHTKVVMLTSYISIKDEKRAKSMEEIVAYIPKLLSPELLHQIHLKALGVD